jgi:hypothetical protein
MCGSYSNDFMKNCTRHRVEVKMMKGDDMEEEEWVSLYDQNDVNEV